ncbi:flagellar biosynthetic protein FliO [Clostridium sp.]|uniref:flagellar biosynthetic protein FliO n=1 Tax=Clostridium sp. TaxID=1506 RepID=UPI001B790885|nr:flagellar biosynthetic protein FliO [Clostridium sp.]MBP3917388.1 flagellar biosynthetic protein FliO [Clostridium sp.]
MDFFIDLVKVISSLMIVISLIFISSKIYISKNNNLNNHRYFKVIETYRISKNSSLILLQIGNNANVILVNNNNPTILKELNEDELKEIQQKKSDNKILNEFKQGVKDKAWKDSLKRILNN